VRSEVKAEDMTAKERIYQLAKHALLDEEALFARLLNQMLKANELPLDDAQTWPAVPKIAVNKGRRRDSVGVCAAATPAPIAAVQHSQAEPSGDVPKLTH